MLSRRRFVQSTALAGAALLIGVRLDDHPAAAADGVLAPNAFVRIAPDNTVTIIAKHIEVGQGSYTGLATILAEELDADWSQVRVEAAPADAFRYGNSKLSPLIPVQATGGSTSMANSWNQLRQAGAAARAMLVEAAAREWSVPASAITVERGVVLHASGRRATFGELARKAAALKPPAHVTLKDPKDPRTTSRAAGIARSTCTACAPGSIPRATSSAGSTASSASRSSRARRPRWPS